MSFIVETHYRSRFLKFAFTLLSSILLGIAAISPQILACCALRVESGNLLFLDVCCEGLGRQREWGAG